MAVNPSFLQRKLNWAGLALAATCFSSRRPDAETKKTTKPFTPPGSAVGGPRQVPG